MGKTIEISMEEYSELLKISVRVDCIRRMVEASEYVSTGEIMAVLDIHMPPMTKGICVNGEL